MVYLFASYTAAQTNSPTSTEVLSSKCPPLPLLSTTHLASAAITAASASMYKAMDSRIFAVTVITKTNSFTGECDVTGMKTILILYIVAQHCSSYCQ